MFKKILIAEDIDTLTLDETILKSFPDAEITYARYCDDALLKAKKALLEENPFDLLITDLSFIRDHREVALSGGEDLIEAVRKIQPKLKIIAYSIEDRVYKIRSLFDNLDVDGYVWKGRESATDMQSALALIAEGKKFISARFSNLLQTSTIIEISDYDKKIISMLANGLGQTEIGEQLSREGMPGSKSNIEKRINHLKISLKANNAVHLISIAKDLGIIS